MKKTAILTMILSLVVVNLCLTAHGEDVSSQISSLEQKAERVQNQINQATQQTNATVDAQVKALNASIDSLVKQRVQVDSHIARLEGQVADLKQSAGTSLNRQVQDYQTELDVLKQQISSLAKKKSAAPSATNAAGPTEAPAAAGQWSAPATAPQQQ